MRAGHQRGVLALVMAQIPFEIQGFHSDNGSEYINGRVAKLLEKLRIEQTKSRSRHSSDNALAESKNASVVRKHMGYSHIPKKYAKPINEFYEKVFNPWLNLHRPCLFAREIVSPKGKVVKRYDHKRRLQKAGLGNFLGEWLVHLNNCRSRLVTDGRATSAAERRHQHAANSHCRPVAVNHPPKDQTLTEHVLDCNSPASNTFDSLTFLQRGKQLTRSSTRRNSCCSCAM
ncbi:MAG: transposase family protein [Burkholderiales bacterium]|nr:transposase family protein [Burkholderiales bacterium]